MVELLEERRLLSVTVSTLPATGPGESNTVDKAGNVYELAVNTVSEVTAASRTLTTLAMLGSHGYKIGSFYYVTTDGAGNLYAYGNAGRHPLRIQPTLTYSILSGPGTISADGDFSSRTFGAALIQADVGDLSGTVGVQAIP
jgi:hypothetical protein